MRENLLGYVLGVLDASEQAEIERALARQPGLRLELENLRRKLRPLEAMREEYEPPHGLAERTCCRVDDEIIDELLEAAPPAGERDLPRAGRSSGLSAAAEQGAGSTSWGWALPDVVVAAGVFLAASLLFFPIIYSSRFSAQIAACQYNLGRVGLQHHTYSTYHGQGRFPYIPAMGNEAYAGYYATQLAENELLPDQNWLICPASWQAEVADEFHVPTRQEVQLAEGPELARLQRMAGGSYAYPLGVVVNGLYQAPRNRSRSYFPLMADAPSQARATGQEPTRNHGGRGYNLLYEDGHVEYLTGSLKEHCQDDPLVNREGFVEAGRGEDDAVLAPSGTSPLLRRLYYRP